MITLFLSWLVWLTTTQKPIQTQNTPIDLANKAPENLQDTKWTLIGIKSVSGYNAYELPFHIDENRGMLAKRKQKESDVYRTFALPLSEMKKLGIKLGEKVLIRCPKTKKPVFKGFVNDYINERFQNNRIDLVVPLAQCNSFFIKDMEVLVSASK